MSPKSIITYLPSWDPQGVRTLELTWWIGKAIIIPRSSLKEVKSRPEMSKASVYFLFWEVEWIGKAYIGETTNLFQRLTNHDTNKDFWDFVIAFISNNESLSDTEIKYLEARSIEIAGETKRYILENAKEQIPKNLPEWKIAEMDEFLGNINLFLSFAGFPLLQKPIQKETNRTWVIYECTGPDAEAKWVYQTDGFLVLKDSKSRIKLSPSASDWTKKYQDFLLKEGVIKVDSENSYRFEQDWIFKSPSAAALFILWRNANGWTEWKNKNGTLDEMERKSIN